MRGAALLRILRRRKFQGLGELIPNVMVWAVEVERPLEQALSDSGRRTHPRKVSKASWFGKVDVVSEKFEPEPLELLVKLWSHLQVFPPAAAVAAAGRSESRCFEFLRTGLRGTVPLPNFSRGREGPESSGNAGSGTEGGSPVGARPSQVISQPVAANAIGATQVFA